MNLITDTYTVRLRRDYPVRYPDICVVCGENCKVRNEIREMPIGYFGLHKWMLFLTEKIKVPSHKQCINQLRKKLFFQNAVALITASVAVAIGIYFNLSKLKAIGIGMVLLFPALLYWMKYPSPFEYSIDGDWKLYLFKDKFYAKTFAYWNNSSIIELD
jgi:hypothetical protein